MQWFRSAILTFLLMPVAVSAIETPDFAVVDTLAGGVEVRCYSPMMLAVTLVDGSRSTAGNKAFRRLAGYIFGGNKSGEKIAMTAPVLQAGQEDGDGYEVAFVMPSSLATPPRPLDDDVELHERSMRVAVMTYKGGWSVRRYEEHLSALSNIVAAQADWQQNGDPIWARYDPPFKPWFLRTNEIMLPVEPTAGLQLQDCDPSSA